MTEITPESVRLLGCAERGAALTGCLRALDVEDYEVQRAALEVLRALDPQAELSALLEDDPRAALQAIMALRDERFGASVGRLVREAERPAVRALAVRALAVLRTPEREALLIGALGDPAPAVRSYAASALAADPTAAARAALRAALEREGDATVKVFIMDGIEAAHRHAAQRSGGGS